jgi:excisionase family DNA binding protein
MTESTPLQTIEQVGTYLGVKRSKVYNLIERGELPVVRIGRSVRIHPDAVREYVERNTERKGARR